MSNAARQIFNARVRQGRGAPAESAQYPGIYVDTLDSLLYFSDGAAWYQAAGTGVWATLSANTFTGIQTINRGATSGADGLILTGAALTGVGTRDSPIISIRGGGFTGGTARVVEYMLAVVVNDPAGAGDLFVIGRNYNDGGDTSLLALDQGGNATLLGDIAAAGGYRRDIMYALSAIAASQTNARMNCGGVALSYVAKRSGSITGLSVQMSSAVTGGSVVVSVHKNGTLQAGSSLTLSGSETTERGVFPKDTVGLTFVAGDVLDVRYTSGAIGETPAILAAMEIED